MKRWKLAIGGMATALVLIGCGGSDDAPVVAPPVAEVPPPKPVFTALVNFGDSLSDVGTYKVGNIAAVGGGQWTVNSATSKNWTALIADKFSLAAPCAAQTGLPSIIPNLPAVTVQNVVTCNNYAQGSSRVTSAFGPGSLAIQQAVYQGTFQATMSEASATAAAIDAGAGLGLMALPVANQMANHLTKVSGTYTGKELVTVMAGGNDIFLNLNGVSSAAAGGRGAAGAAQFAGWSATVQGTVAGGGATATNAAIQAAVGGMTQAGTELATLVKTQVLAKGAKYVVVVNLPDVSSTPFASAFPAETKALLVSLANAFNNALTTGLSGQAGVIVVDAFTQSKAQVADPIKFGITNTTTPACAAGFPANILFDRSLTCTTSNTVAGDVSKYLFADGVHLTPYGYQLLADFVEVNLVAAKWK